MRIIAFVFLLLILGVLTYWGVVFYQKFKIGSEIARTAEPFRKVSGDETKTLLVLGDSTGVGVGATRPEDSVAGFLAADMQATYVENKAVSGAWVSDVPAQIGRAKLARYDTILLQIGGNDVIRFHSIESVSAELSHILQTLQKRGDRVLLMSMGNVGTTTIFPPPLRFFHTKVSMQYHAAFTKAANDNGATYINLYTPPESDPYVKNPEIYFAADGLHPSSAGYALWYKRLQETIAK